MPDGVAFLGGFRGDETSADQRDPEVFESVISLGDADLDGNPRLADDPGIPGVFVDLGAYEFQGVTCLPDVNQHVAVTPADANAWILNFHTGCP